MRSNYSNYFKKDTEDRLTSACVGCLMALLALVLLIGLTFLYAAIGCWLWGAIIVPVFGAPVLTYWQMYGLIILARMILGTSSKISTSNK